MLLRRLLACAAASAMVLTGCSDPESEAEPTEVSVEAPEVGACRQLTAEDINNSTDDTDPVDCAEPHTAETFLVSEFTGKAAKSDHDDARLGAQAYKRCQAQFIEFVGGTESLVMRSMLTWAWFRPTDEQWEAGARWFRCDVVGGGEQSESLVELPETAEGVLLGQPDDRWMVCADGETVAGSEKVSCDRPHTWRAVTTIVLGQPKDPYPGQRLVEVKTRDFCSESVGAWLNYPLEYDYGYTWFHEPEWKAGNRRSICWAKTDQ